MSQTPITDAHQSACLRSGGRSCEGGKNAYWLARLLERKCSVLHAACAEVMSEVGSSYLACKPQLRSAIESHNHAVSLWDVERVLELLKTLSSYPVATTHPDGPCIEREDMEEIRDILHNSRID